MRDAFMKTLSLTEECTDGNSNGKMNLWRDVLSFVCFFS